MRRIAIGEIIIDLSNNYTNPDIGSGQIEVSNSISFGQINAFVGMVKSSRPGIEESEHQSSSETAAMTRSDGEESVGTTEVDLSKTLQEDDPAWAPRRVIEDDDESAIKPSEDCYGYEEEEYGLSLGPIRRVGVYTTPATNFDPALISAGTTVIIGALAQNQQAQQNQQDPQDQQNQQDQPNP